MPEINEVNPFTKTEVPDDPRADGVRILQPFVSTVNGPGDFRPKAEVTSPQEADPKDVLATASVNGKETPKPPIEKPVDMGKTAIKQPIPAPPATPVPPSAPVEILP